MEQLTGKDRWVDDVMDSLNGMQRIPATPDMYDNVMQRISFNASSVIKNNPVVFRRAAAAAILLFIINLASIIHLSHKPVTTRQQDVYKTVNEEVSYLSEDSY